jgi:tetratricopeptide (TPR) repeat protein
LPILAFHRDLPGPDERERQRDLGLALIALARKLPAATAQVPADRALPLLEETVRTWPGDVPSWEGKVHALLLLERTEEAREAGEAALALAPERELVLADMIAACQALRLPAEGLRYCRRALAIAPASAAYRLNEARMLAQLEDWSGAVASAREAVQIDPFLVDPHLILVDGYLHTGRKDEARAELDLAAALDPAQAEKFRSWFADPLR